MTARWLRMTAATGAPHTVALRRSARPAHWGLEAWDLFGHWALGFGALVGASPVGATSSVYPVLGDVSDFVTPLRAARSAGSSSRPWSFVSSIHFSNTRRRRCNVR